MKSIHGIREEKEMKDIRFFEGREISEIVKKETYYNEKPVWITHSFSDIDYKLLENLLSKDDCYAFVLFVDGLIQGIDKTLYDELNRVFNFDKNTTIEKQGGMKINVLGTEYDVEVLKERDEYMKDNTLQGYCDKTSKRIVICPYDNDFDDKEKLKENILRHELIHAFLFESGIDYGMLFHNEECVDFFAMQFPKLVKMFEEANCKE